MKPKIILIEGLPGAGKSTMATLTYDFLVKKSIPADIYLEGNLDHPADYDGVAHYLEQEFNNLIVNNTKYKELLMRRAIKHDNGVLIPYQKMRKDISVDIPDVLLEQLSKNDIYELPLDEHINLITEKWWAFGEKAKREDKTYIFECCYIQNPVTAALVKYNAPKQKAIDYVQGLTVAVKALNPLLIYVDQKDIGYTFRKALNERSKGWADFFINYYTNQGYGLANELVGVEGTIKVLEQRAKLEKEIIGELGIDTVFIDNSSYNQGNFKKEIELILEEKFHKLDH